MDTIAARLALQYPDSDKTLGVQVRRLKEYIAGEMRRAAAVAFALRPTTTAPRLHQSRNALSRARRRACAGVGGPGCYWRHSLAGHSSATDGILATRDHRRRRRRATRRSGTPSDGGTLPLTVPRLDETRIDTPVLVFSFFSRAALWPRFWPCAGAQIFPPPIPMNC